ncbi:hypothetical protein ACFLQR_05275, partial [Verrucomicrobiota bacterium]
TLKVKTTKKPVISLSGKRIAVKKLSGKTYEANFKASVGRHSIAITADGQRAERLFCAVKDFKEATVLMADALRTLQKNTAQAFPKVAGVIPNTYRLNDLEPYVREEGYIACCYMPRTVMVMTAAGLLTGKIDYVNSACRALDTYLSKGLNLKDGSISLPAAINPEGEVNPEWVEHPRPSDYAIMLRGYLYCEDAYRKFKKGQQAESCLKKARLIGLSLEKMQGRNGSFSSRYNYVDPEFTKPGVAVNNVSWCLYQLYERLQSAGNSSAEKIKESCLKYIQYELSRENPSLLRVPGPGAAESIPLYHDDFITLGCHLTAAHYSGMDKMDKKESKRLSEEAVLCSVFAGCSFYIDQPEAFSFSASQAKLPIWLGGVPGPVGKGGMQDKSGNELLLAHAKRYKSTFARTLLKHRFLTRSAWSLEENGAMNGMDMNVPGYRYRNTLWTEELNYGGPGFAAHLFVR